MAGRRQCRAELDWTVQTCFWRSLVVLPLHSRSVNPSTQASPNRSASRQRLCCAMRGKSQKFSVRRPTFPHPQTHTPTSRLLINRGSHRLTRRSWTSFQRQAGTSIGQWRECPRLDLGTGEPRALQQPWPVLIVVMTIVSTRNLVDAQP
jgi:hypothetical protein